MAWAFIGPPAEGQICRHLDGDRLNNRVENLAWGTSADNRADDIRNGVVWYRRGEEHVNSRLTEEQVRTVRRLRAEGLMYREIGEAVGIDSRHAHAICSRRAWSHVA